MGYGCGHLKYDEEIHDAKWGARLIYNEVARGGGGVVYDRQQFDGDQDKGDGLSIAINRALEEFRLHQYELPDSQSGHLVWRDFQNVVVLSPQGSYGYLYITAVHERDGHANETHIWEFEDNPERVELGNWPPRIVEAREAQAKKTAASALEWAEREWKWALMDVRAARTPRAETIRQKKADALRDKVYQLREQAGVV